MQGLTESEAQARLLAEGPDSIADQARRSNLARVLGVLREPMFLLLIAAGGLYGVLGERREAILLGCFAGLIICVQIVQEGRSDRAIEALKNLAVAKATVIRDGVRRSLPASEVVRGDLLAIREGERIAADGWLVEASELTADEAILTGESLPVTKRARDGNGTAAPPAPGGDGLAYAWSGTLVVRGSGIMEVAATGPRCEVGRIGASLAMVQTGAPRLVAQTRSMVRWFALVGLGVSVLAAVLYGLLRDSWLNAALAGIALTMSLLPEELPVVLTLFMAMGALRMARVRVLARRGSVIEALGSATVLCTDKTGTLTENRMAISELRLPDGSTFLPDQVERLVVPAAFTDLAGLGILACQEAPFDPMETAFHDLGNRHDGESLGWRQGDGWTHQRQYGISPDLLAVSHVWGKSGGDFVVATKGAPEAIARLCGLGGEELAALERAVAEMAERGLRVLGVAEARWTGPELPDSQQRFDFAFRGLVGLADPIRETVPGAVGMIQRAGVRMVMITGDYPLTARAIAGQAGIAPGAVMTGDELAQLDDEALVARIRDVSVFARVVPEQKLRIVEALKRAGEIVAMTGDGVNDAPSLKAAHIGIAMGARGTDVAREASAMVLLDDDFGAIPDAIRLGRRIFDNLRKAMAFIFAVHVPIGGLALVPLLAGWPMILGPVHIALLEMVIDPVCSIAFEAEPEERDIMERPPRDPGEPLFPRGLLLWSLLQGMIALVAVTALAWWARGPAGMDAGTMRSTAFGGLVVAVLVLVVTNRSYRSGDRLRLHRNRALFLIMGFVVAAFALLFGVPALSQLFALAPLSIAGLAGIAVTGAALAAAMPLAARALFGKRARRAIPSA